MIKLLIHLFFTGLLISNISSYFIFEFSDMIAESVNAEHKVLLNDPVLKKEAFHILKSKCNSCHRRKNPFKIFSLKNMDKHAKKIHKQVFVYRRMPKGDDVKLTDEEYLKLKNWLNSKNIN